MHVRLAPARLSLGAGAIQARADEMAVRRTHIEASVDSLLATWRGDAASRFAALWEEWRDGADTVIAGLSAGAVAVRDVRDDLCGADSRSSEIHDLLSRRLG
jgi:WXG100 family type VII secretion target